MRDGDQREVGRSGEVIEDVLFLELVDLVQHQHVRLICGLPEAVDQFVTGRGLSGDIERAIEALEGTILFETLWEWSELGTGSVLISDERTALASVLVDDDASDKPDETAIWGSGSHNSLVVILRALFTSRLGDDPPNSGR